jgi:predicted TPR repeat methyltransferase
MKEALIHETTVRMESATPVPGWIVVLQREH